jgi:serine/threonine-protein phosphatase 4 regulatory subunit 1|eukprot:COSAG01_NODE_617_length_14808_cov_8.352437_4_plen_564_part_00
MSDTARQVGFADALETLTAVIGERVEDEETDVRLTLAEQIGELALVFIETGGEDGYHQTVEVLLKRTGKLLVDPQATVRQAAGAALVQIAKHLTKEHLESPALGMVLCLAHDESDDHRQLAAHLLNDMAASFGKEICTNFCVPELRSLSEDQEFGVRKAAARNMALVCRTVGQELSEEKMLPVYMQLAKDEIWGVRKSCAEALSDMAACMPSSCRSEQLVTVFTGLQNDVSRWVRFAAFQQLGPLIATMEPEEVSEEILKQFTSMAHMEGETTLYCAFNMPGVLVTVGPSRWHLLKDAYMVLVSDVQWKVRKSLAYSLHEVAHILGQEVTESDICEQVFDKFLKDLDEVRVGVLKHFAAFVGVLSPEKRKGYLEVLTQSYLEPENIGRDWRVRQILATEIGKLTDVLDLRDIQEVLEPTLFNFANDPVATVRGSAHAAFGPLLLRYQQEGGDFALRDRVIDQITAFAAADKFAERQVFVQICEKLATTEDEQRQAACIDLLEKFFLAKALSLASDRVANVRLTVARMLAAIVQERECLLISPPPPPLIHPISPTTALFPIHRR